MRGSGVPILQAPGDGEVRFSRAAEEIILRENQTSSAQRPRGPTGTTRVLQKT